MVERNPLQVLSQVADQAEQPDATFANDLLERLLNEPAAPAADSGIAAGTLGLPDGEETDRRRLLWPLIGIAAAIALIVGAIALRSGDNDKTIVVDDPTTTTSTVPLETTTTSTPTPTTEEEASQFSELPPALGRLLRSGDPLLNPGLAPGIEAPALVPGTYSLALVDLGESATIEITDGSGLPGGVAFTDQMRDGELTRQAFIPAAPDAEAYELAAADFTDPSPPVGDPTYQSIMKSPVLEFVQLRSLGETARDAAELITGTQGVELLPGPDSATIGGASGFVIETLATDRIVIATGEPTAGLEPGGLFL